VNVSGHEISERRHRLHRPYEGRARHLGDEEKRALKAVLAKHREYQHVKAELGKQLQLESTDINPLDITFDSDPEWTSPDDPGIAIWKRAIDIYRRLSEAHLDWLLWWRPKKASSGNVIRLRPEAKGPF